MVVEIEGISYCPLVQRDLPFGAGLADGQALQAATTARPARPGIWASAFK
jgi:hypothetical protein